MADIKPIIDALESIAATLERIDHTLSDINRYGITVQVVNGDYPINVHTS